MKEVTRESAALACVAGAISAAERPVHFALLQQLFGSVAQERNSVPKGYAFRFPVAALEDLARFVSNERKCCPFLDFEITVPSGAEAVWLRLAGPEGTQAFLDAELPPHAG